MSMNIQIEKCKILTTSSVAEECCCFSVAKLCPALCHLMDCGALGFPVLQISWSLLKLMSIEFAI